MAICSLVYPFLAKLIINRYVPQSDVTMIWVLALSLLAIYVTKAALEFVVQYWGHIAGTFVQKDMRRDLFRHIQSLPFSYFDKHKTGSIMSRIVNDLFEISELAHHGLEDFLTSAMTMIGAFILMAINNIWLTLISFALIPFMILFAVKRRKAMSGAFKKSREETSKINARVESSISGIRVSKAYTAEETEKKRFDDSNAEFQRARSKAYKQMGIFDSGMGLFSDLLYLVVLIAGALFRVYGYIDNGEFTAFILYITVLLGPIKVIVSLYQQIQDGMTGFKRFSELMAIEGEKDDPEAVDVDTLKGDIVFDNVTFAYKEFEGEEKSEDEIEVASKGNVLENFSLKIAAGSTVALVGESGGGKTTICHLLPRFYETDGGKITIDGIDTRKITLKSLRKNIGMVAQDVFLFSGTVRENIAYGDMTADDERIIEAAKNANIHDFIMSLPNGYDTEVGERGVLLSGGQKQRISIARAFLKNPPILILDEATSALDNITEMQIQEALNKLCVGRTTLVVAHRLSTVKKADEIIVLSGKGIDERGTHEELMRNNGFYAKLYNYQLRT